MCCHVLPYCHLQSHERAAKVLLCVLPCVQEIAPFLRVLGTYPMDTELGFTSCDDPNAMAGNGSAAQPARS